MRIPLIMRPKLNRAEVSLTPRSLKAFLVQLNHGEREMVKNMHVKATIGLATPHIPAILSRVAGLVLGMTCP